MKTLAYAAGVAVVRIPYVTDVTDGGNSSCGGLTLLQEVQCGAVNQSYCVRVAEMKCFVLAVIGAPD